jgi:hypothetical protein
MLRLDWEALSLSFGMGGGSPLLLFSHLTSLLREQISNDHRSNIRSTTCTSPANG